MTHAAEGLLQAWIDGEVDGSAAAELDRHLSGCALCMAEARRLRAAATQLTGALSLLDTPLPAEAGEQAWWRARQAARRPAFARFTESVLGRAAVLTLFAAGVASAALPGSPVREAISSLLADDAGPAAPGATEAPEARAPSAAPEAAAARAEMAVLPADGRVRVLIWSAAPDATVTVNFVAGERVTVRAGGELGEVRFRSGPGRLEVYDLGPGQATVDLPRSLAQASIEVDGRQYLFQDGDRLRTPGPVSSRTAQTVVFRVP
ncbi:MAG TPA: zf-HC2 domain-containing protein [Longimicrobiales bacterium]|nr:zf-HC2 domain-containing protein [Longimicrobiales bacterium]